MERATFVLDGKDMPTQWYNIQADLPEPLPPPLHPGTKQPLGPADLAPINIASGWTWDLVRTEGVIALAGFWERFFTIGFHTGASALAAYGLSKGKGVQFYFLAVIAHAVLNYSVLMVQKGIFSFVFAEVYIAIIALFITGVTIWLRWRKQAVPVKKKKT